MEITKIQKEVIAKIAKKYGLTLVLLFGSQARGRTHQGSDVDIGFLSDSSMGLHEVACIEFEMAQNMKISHLELVRLAGMPSLFLQQVVRDGRVLYEDGPGAFSLFASYAFKRFVEEKPLRALKESSLRTFSSARV
ncbi:MAG: nucleotidyltransferase domain-containing protein [Candidatus Uhrbacteria bacterium]|nr:nucleotidyltransferase domain-containing protein [Candidatus Uhrbacteria bacterium]